MFINSARLPIGKKYTLVDRHKYQNKKVCIIKSGRPWPYFYTITENLIRAIFHL